MILVHLQPQKYAAGEQDAKCFTHARCSGLRKLISEEMSLV